MWGDYDIYTIRYLINEANSFTDPSELNECLKKKEEQIISDYNPDTLLSPFDKLYKAFFNERKAYEEHDEANYYTYKRDYIRIVNRMKDDNIHNELMNRYENGGIVEARKYIQNLSDRCLSNYIIDYSFEENYHNVIIDIKELLNFYNQGNIDISKERIELYSRIANIDSLSVDEKKDLHNILRNYNIIETFYDDMSFARNIVAKSIKDYSLTKETLKKYKNEELSKKYGVEVYEMNNKPFFGIVKTGRHVADELPTGHSYSLIGNGGLAVFGNVDAATTYLYDASDLNPEQIVHVFPYDSFTLYRPFGRSQYSTDRVYTLMKPDELVGSNKSYSEIVILEKGKKETEIDKEIPRLKRIAVYCLDKINNEAVTNAQDSGIGIILVSTEECKFESSIPDKYRHVEQYDYNYFVNPFDKGKFESKRL